MQPIDEKEAIYLASICAYWEIVDAQYKRTLATSADGFAFEAKLNEFLQHENIKALVLYFGDFRKEAKAKGAYILTTDNWSDEDAPMLMPQRERKQLYGLGNIPAKQQGMSPEHVQSMIALEMAKMQALMQKQDNERQFDFFSKQLDTQKEIQIQQLDFEREKLEWERTAFEEQKALAGAQPPIVQQILDGIVKIAPALAGLVPALAGIGAETAKQPEAKAETSKQSAIEFVAKPKEATMTFTAKPKAQEVEPTANPLAGLSPQQQERLLKLAEKVKADPVLLDELEDLADAPLAGDDEDDETDAT